MKLLIQGAAILAQEPFTEAEDRYITYRDGKEDQHIPKQQVGQIVDVDVPDDFSCARYGWDGYELVMLPPVIVPPEVPQSVSRAQGLVALEMAGCLSTIEVMMADPNTPRLTKIAFNEAQTFERDSPTLAQLAEALGMTDAQVDQLFIEAAKVKL